MKKFTIKASFLLAAVFLLQIGVAFIWPPRIPKEIASLNEALRKKTDVIYLGDSTVYWCGPADRTTQTIVTKVQHKIPSLSFHETTHGGYHMGVYADYCRWIASSGHLPRLIVIPINVRTFSPFWDNPGWQFENVQYTLAYLRNPLFRIFYSPLGVFRFFKMETTEEQYMATPVYDGLRPVGTVWDFKIPESGKWTQEQVKSAFQFFYMGQITEQNRKTQLLRQIIRNLNKAGIPILLYFVPTDIQSGVHYQGERLRQQFRQNVSFLEQVIRQEGASSYNFSEALGPDYFVWRMTGDCVDEHLNEAGREFVANELSKKIPLHLMKR